MRILTTVAMSGLLAVGAFGLAPEKSDAAAITPAVYLSSQQIAAQIPAVYPVQITPYCVAWYLEETNTCSYVTCDQPPFGPSLHDCSEFEPF